MQLAKASQVNAPFSPPLFGRGVRNWKELAFGLFIAAGFLLSGICSSRAEEIITDENPLVIPAPGSYGLRILSPTVLEVTFINTKQPDPAGVSGWDFVEGTVGSRIPSPGQFVVKVDGLIVPVTQSGFKRRPIYAPEKPRDLRIANNIYLVLGVGISEGQKVSVLNPSGLLWSNVKLETTMNGMRYSPAIHVNQVGYMPEYPKKAQVGYYLGSLGELHVPAGSAFSLVSAVTGQIVLQGVLRSRFDEGFIYEARPYQKVLEADFSAFKTVGEYRLVVPGAGASLPFRINDGVTANYARTFALGLANQRCGCANQLPYTRHTHGLCHARPAEIPTMDPAFSHVQDFLKEVSDDFADESRHTAPQLKTVDSSLYPFERQGTVDVSGGHHDAGDYSKYTINSAGLVHALVFAADSFAGAGALDNLGIPESGDGKSDLLQEAKWEADFLAKMQDSDGGFYFLVYPKTRRYENNVLPENGDSQVVWPKNTAVTAAAVGALAEAGSSPLMNAQFPEAARMYLEKARRGWTFLMDAIAFNGKDGAYQKMTHYGNEFMHDDELAWAAAAMFVATGDPVYQAKLFEFLPNPNDVSVRRWTWWRLFEGYGCAIRDYAFAVRSGRLDPSGLDELYLGQCEAEIVATADDHVRFSRQSAYGTSFPDTNKQYRSAGWYFSSERAFDVTTAYQLSARPEYIETVVANYNYEGGSNPLNMTYVTGLGWKRQREVVSQYAWNDHRILPPAGLPQGNIQAGFGDLKTYKSPVTDRSELTLLSFPGDFVETNTYPFYDRWCDMVNTMTEFVVMDQARSLASLSFWMAQGTKKSQGWTPVLGQVVGLDQAITSGVPSNLSVTVPGIDLSEAQVVWELRYIDPEFGNPAMITPKYPGEHWIEAEALLPDGRRVVAVSNFVASAGVMAPNSFRSRPVSVSPDTVALYHFDGNTSEANGRQPALTLRNGSYLDAHNLAWMSERSGSALRVLDFGDVANVEIPTSALQISPSTTGITLEAMIYVNEFKAYDRGVGKILSLIEAWNASLELVDDKYAGRMARGGVDFEFSNPELNAALTLKTWHHLSISITRVAYYVRIDGQMIASRASTALQNWGHSPTLSLELGNFDGWIDEVVVRNTGLANAVLTPLKPNGQGGFRVRVQGEQGRTYRMQASQDSRVWTDVGSVTLLGGTAEFVDMTLGPSYRFYRAVVQ